MKSPSANKQQILYHWNTGCLLMKLQKYHVIAEASKQASWEIILPTFKYSSDCAVFLDSNLILHNSSFFLFPLGFLYLNFQQSHHEFNHHDLIFLLLRLFAIVVFILAFLWNVACCTKSHKFRVGEVRWGFFFFLFS